MEETDAFIHNPMPHRGRTTAILLATGAMALLFSATFLIGPHLTQPLTLHGTVLMAPDGKPGPLNDSRAFVWLGGSSEEERSEQIVDEVEFVIQPEGPGKRFIPLRVGQKLRVRNNGSKVHSFLLRSKHNGTANRAIVTGGFSAFNNFRVPEVPIISATCGCQGTEGGFIGVFENPYFTVSEVNGRFAIPEVPPGTYQVYVYHPEVGIHSQETKVSRWWTDRVSIELAMKRE